MPSSISAPKLPSYQGLQWIEATLPDHAALWLEQQPFGWMIDDPVDQSLIDELKALSHLDKWHWPDHLILFVSDLHADVDAFSSSLVASGLFRREGPAPEQISVIENAPTFEIIIGGDCLDKGPANLPLLKLIRWLYDQNILVTLLSGNHDLRLQLAINTLDTPECSLNGHFLIRLGSKVMPLCVELLKEYPLSIDEMAKLPNEATCKQNLLPSEAWYQEFEQRAKSHLTDAQIATEIRRLCARKQRFFRAAEQANLSMQQIYAALLRWRQLFMQSDGDFHWFIAQQQLLCRRGSFVFLHAGCDDLIAERLALEGEERLNQEYSQARQGDAFHLYFSALGNMLRTKYRSQDPQLSTKSRAALDKAGIHALVHGHRNLHHGQRITLRAKTLHFECDSTLNQTTRKEEGLVGKGAAVTLFYPDGWVIGISSDYPSAKCFCPSQLNLIADQLQLTPPIPT